MSGRILSYRNQCRSDRRCALVRWLEGWPADTRCCAQWRALSAARRNADPCLPAAETPGLRWLLETGTVRAPSPAPVAAPGRVRSLEILPTDSAATDGTPLPCPS